MRMTVVGSILLIMDVGYVGNRLLTCIQGGDFGVSPKSFISLHKDMNSRSQEIEEIDSGG